MTPRSFVCQNCNQILVSADAVCPDCDAALEPHTLVFTQDASHASTLLNGRPFKCPVCEGTFKKPLATPWPIKTKWYMLQGARQYCPHCKVFLKSKYEQLDRYLHLFFILLTFVITKNADWWLQWLWLLPLLYSAQAYLYRFNDMQQYVYEPDFEKYPY